MPGLEIQAWSSVRTDLNGFHRKEAVAFGYSYSRMCQSGDGFSNIAAPLRQLSGVQPAGLSVSWSQVSCPC